jgi:uncharacterized protein
MTHTDSGSDTLKTICVSIVASRQQKIWRRKLCVPSETTILEAVQLSGYLDHFPSTLATDLLIGVFGSRVSHHYQLQAHDRIEIYEPLQVDPKVARRRRAIHRNKVKK